MTHSHTHSKPPSLLSWIGVTDGQNLDLELRHILHNLDYNLMQIYNGYVQILRNHYLKKKE